ncbi:hypothetical protein UlMin_005288 [Ulmus minor]
MPNWRLFRFGRSFARSFKTTSFFQKHPPFPASSFFFSTSIEFRADNENPTRPAPPPIRVGITESAGRGVFATRKIGQGEQLHTAKPLISYPSLSLIQRVCYFCLRKLVNRSSDQVQGVSFCSDDCKEQSKAFLDVERKADWSAYDDYCRSHGLKYPLMVKRFACMIISGATSPDLLDILQPASLSPELISQLEEGFYLLQSAFTAANIPDEQIAFLTKQWYTGVLARIRINAFRIDLAGGAYEDLLLAAAASVENEAAVGNAVYMLPSFYNHDCDPNAHIIWIENVDARLKALRDVDEGEELKICYIDASINREARQAVLSQGFGFQCNCPRCLSDD